MSFILSVCSCRPSTNISCIEEPPSTYKLPLVALALVVSKITIWSSVIKAEGLRVYHIHCLQLVTFYFAKIYEFFYSLVLGV